MRRITWIVAVVMMTTLVLAACGVKGSDEVVKDLNHVVKKLDSYGGVGTMTIHTGQEPQEYSVEVWYKNPSYYRIALTNSKKDITQIVLRNDEGVFVLTPHLKKSFRFQSDWPENQGQVYLYQTLVESILADKERKFAAEKDTFVFDVLANYQNASFARQKIWLAKKDYAPKHVDISDNSGNPLVSVDFSSFEFDKKFEKDSFDMERNLTSFNLQALPTMGQEGDETAGAGTEQATGPFGIMEPLYMPEGVKLKDTKELKQADGETAILLRYTGDFNYTILEKRPQASHVSAPYGEPVQLGFTVGVLTGEEKRTLSWTHDGVEYRLTSDDLPEEEMILIAQSLEDSTGK